MSFVTIGKLRTSVPGMLANRPMPTSRIEVSTPLRVLRPTNVLYTSLARDRMVSKLVSQQPVPEAHGRPDGRSAALRAAREPEVSRRVSCSGTVRGAELQVGARTSGPGNATPGTVAGETVAPGRGRQRADKRIGSARQGPTGDGVSRLHSHFFL